MKKIVSFLKRNYLLILSVFCGSLLIILFNFYTIKISASIRSYINAESSYSKGQKDATKYLLQYIVSESETDWLKYKENIAIPFGTRKFREEILGKGNEQIMNQGMLEARNHKDDLGNFIWLFRNFHEFGFMKEAIGLWTEGDSLNLELDRIAHLAYASSHNGTDKYDVNDLRAQIITIDKKLSILEYAFSDTLSTIGRKVESGLYISNLFFIIIIVGGGGIYFIMLISRLNKSEAALKVRNEHLNIANMELDKFVYSVSHDLRAPLTSIQGLVELLRFESEQADIPNYLNMIDESLARQDRFIKKILSYSRNKRTVVDEKIIEVEGFIDSIFQDLEHSEKAKGIRFEKDLKLNDLLVDEDRLRVVMNNIVSNAIEYSDDAKESFIKVVSNIEGDNAVIVVQDNGLGIQESHKDKIFDMFFSGANSQNGSGIGLYIVKEAVEKMNGGISLSSEYEIGSAFKITLPLVRYSEN